MDLVVVVEKAGFGLYYFCAAVVMATMAVLEITPGCG
ncbi:hypothetical protein C820_001498 [Clostridium sp. MD294]|nr:hypothetical protein C820_001498 [Clostridium sp. MD294]